MDLEVWNGIWKKILVWNGIWKEILVWNGMEDFWYGMEMEWKKIASMEYGKIVFHSIPYHVLMPSINSINFYQNRPKIVISQKKKSSSAGVSAPTPPVAGFLPQTPIAPGGWGIRSQTPATPQPHCRFLAMGLHEEKFTARYCRRPFILTFGFKCTWNVWRRRCSHSQTVYNTAKSISPGNTYAEKLSQKIFLSAPTPLWPR